jgi:Flp pilus assembly protein TadD
MSGQVDEALTAFETAESLAKTALEVNPNDPSSQMDLAWISAMLGKFDTARKFIDQARSQASDNPYVHYIDALILLRIGETESALSALELAADKGYSLQMIAAEPHLASIRENPRFRAILDRI